MNSAKRIQQMWHQRKWHQQKNAAGHQNLSFSAEIHAASTSHFDWRYWFSRDNAWRMQHCGLLEAVQHFRVSRIYVYLYSTLGSLGCPALIFFVLKNCDLCFLFLSFNLTLLGKSSILNTHQCGWPRRLHIKKEKIIRNLSNSKPYQELSAPRELGGLEMKLSFNVI